MSSIFHGGNTYIFYNTDAGNNIPTSIDYKNIDNLGAFPQVKIQSSTNQFETYNDEWIQVLSGQMSIQAVSIVVHYVPDNTSHQYLDAAFTNQTKFQIKVSLYKSQESLEQHYVILSGYVSAYQDSADQNEIFDRTYTFAAEDIRARGTAINPTSLKQGDFGLGADGETIPQYESSTPSGNSFIKVPATRQDNPLGVDLGGFAYIDNGGDQSAQFVISETGPINIFAKNTDNQWTLLPSKTQSDQSYVPMVRTINSKPLTANVVLTKADIGLGSVLNIPSYSKTESDSTFLRQDDATSTYLTQTIASSTYLSQEDANSDYVLKTITINGHDLSQPVVLESTDTGSLAAANNLSDVQDVTIARTNLVAATSGVNSDITGLTKLSGSLRLGGDASGDYDAVTLRQLLAASGGAGGPNLTGVMNNYVGAVSWFNGSRAKLPAGHVASDGQILNRADYPEIWNAISTGMFVSYNDTDWMASPARHAAYSTGNGTTTFRMPDLNGKLAGSISGLFLRGDGTGFSVGTVAENAVPNLRGALAGRNNSTVGALFNNGAVGVFYPSVPATAINQLVQSATVGPLEDRNINLNFDASRSDAAYGRDSSTEVRPNAATGIWIIRLNGQFSASSTNFNVINGDTSLPASGTTVYGGDVRSAYQVAGSDYAVARLRAKVTIGSSSVPVISLTDSSTGSVVNKDWTMPVTTGELVIKESLGSAAYRNAVSNVFDKTSGNLMTTGTFGLGGVGQSQVLDTDATVLAFYRSGTSQFHRNNNDTTYSYRYSASILSCSSDTWMNFCPDIYGRGVLISAGTNNGTTLTNYQVYTDKNTTKASDGTLKAASPVARIVTSDTVNERVDLYEEGFTWCGAGTCNVEALGINISRTEVGVYILTGSSGLAKEGWRLLPPRDPNGSGDLGIVEATESDGIITINLYRQKYMLSVDGEIEKVKGTLIDVPANSWIDIRLDMSDKNSSISTQ